MIRPMICLAFLAATAAVVPRFFALGFTHILPNGLDHILFILGLFFLTRGFAPLLLQMTLFTLAHTLTLGWGSRSTAWWRLPRGWSRSPSR
jgi:hypothetical protein